jgi:hypothetical protein
MIWNYYVLRNFKQRILSDVPWSLEQEHLVTTMAADCVKVSEHSFF